jgi:hypothetical protein
MRFFFLFRLLNDTATSFFEDGLGDGFQPPNESHPGKHFESVEGDIDLPPVEAVSGAALITVMVVVPAFPEADQSEDEAVPGIVRGFEPAAAHEVGEGINARRTVKKEGCAHEEAPHQKLEAIGMQGGYPFLQEHSESEGAEGEQQGNHQIKTVQPDQLRELRQVFDFGVIRREIAAGGDPADVGPQEAVGVRRMSIFRLVRVQVVVAVMISPPERTPLHGGTCPNRHHELEEPRGAVGFVRKVPVMDACDGKHPQEVQGDRKKNREGAGSRPYDPETTEVQESKRQNADPIHAIGSIPENLRSLGTVVGINPLNDRCTETAKKRGGNGR